MMSFSDSQESTYSHASENSNGYGHRENGEVPRSTDEDEASAAEREQRVQQDTLRNIYNQSNGIEECKSVARDVRCAVRDHLVSKVKFLDTLNKKTFPSYSYHDFTDANHYLTNFVDEKLNYKMESLESKATFWITYAKTVKKEVANHRATCASSMKDAFIKGN